MYIYVSISIRYFLVKKIKKNQFLKKEGEIYFAKKCVKKQGKKRPKIFTISGATTKGVKDVLREIYKTK